MKKELAVLLTAVLGTAFLARLQQLGRADGYEVECILEGLGQNADIQQIYVSHTQDAIDSIAE